MPSTLMKKIEGKRAIWLHAASVGEIVATSPLVKDIKKSFPDAVVVVSVVTATGHAMARRIIPEAEGIIFFPLDLPFLTRRILNIIKTYRYFTGRNRNLAKLPSYCERGTNSCYDGEWSY